ncbi:hypothetical protein ACJX0J_016263, partial [Zea mays]
MNKNNIGLHFTGAQGVPVHMLHLENIELTPVVDPYIAGFGYYDNMRGSKEEDIKEVIMRPICDELLGAYSKAEDNAL